jgi:hypothetical protein
MMEKFIKPVCLIHETILLQAINERFEWVSGKGSNRGQASTFSSEKKCFSFV